jgi:hypothetical protein
MILFTPEKSFCQISENLLNKKERWVFMLTSFLVSLVGEGSFSGSRRDSCMFNLEEACGVLGKDESSS